ncbi:hypothetical protein IV203_035372 [Nitzschia inconspicua]|uniref:DUF6824 domain-containing protein n=1 Tax=Nitzschia inconspicua TaxID=303405 RepID=A0A9K3LEX0_9STRA|nr:hypothetical protein IV203_035372 [Nitzschia inconspicua]
MSAEIKKDPPRQQETDPGEHSSTEVLSESLQESHQRQNDDSGPTESNVTRSLDHDSRKNDQKEAGDEGDDQDDSDKDDDHDANPKKKAKTEQLDSVRTIPGFDLPMDTSSTIIPPSNEGTAIFNEHDVLSGRGGGTNVHFGNRSFRDIINRYREIYLKSKKNDKPAISRAIVKEIRSRGGRFLKKNEKDKLYYEIGDAQAREKTSQALRQRAPEMRKLMFEKQQMGAPGSGIPNLMGGIGILHSQPPPSNGTSAAGPGSSTTAAAAATDAGFGHSSVPNGNAYPDEQFRMALPLLNGMHPNFAAGLQAGMEFHHSALMASAAGATGSGGLMGANGYSPAFYHGMMAGMGISGGAVNMGVGGNTENVQNAHAGGTEAPHQGDIGADLNQRSGRHPHSNSTQGM